MEMNKCESCGDMWGLGNVASFEGRRLCPDCLDSLGVKGCDICAKLTKEGTNHADGLEWVCPDCLSKIKGEQV